MSESLSPETPTEPSARPERSWRLPQLSGKATAACLVLFFLATALLIPGVVRLPLWLDFEIVVGIWWLVWLILLTLLLYRGQRVTDDHQLGQPRNWLGALRGESKDTPNGGRKSDSSSSGWGDGIWWFNAGDGEGCLMLLGIVVALVVAFFALWFLIEIAIPVVVFLLYCVMRGMLAAVINDRHRCRGRFVRAAVWGFIWATVYTAPLALVVWFVHELLRRQAGA